MPKRLPKEQRVELKKWSSYSKEEKISFLRFRISNTENLKFSQVDIAGSLFPQVLIENNRSLDVRRKKAEDELSLLLNETDGKFMVGES